jgi:uncharacterized SAM-binding protein YcdF (DUF218 family)
MVGGWPEVGLAWYALKATARALLLPPTPLLLLAGLGWALAPRRPRTGRALLLVALLGLWGVCTTAGGDALVRLLTQPPPPLSPAQRAELVDAPHTAVLVLGAGRRVLQPEYGGPDLQPLGQERLRYGAWLARQTRLPLGFSGGASPGTDPGPSEAEVAAAVLQRQGEGPLLRWRESRSLDTDGNARESVRLLAAAGIRRTVLVTHGFHQRRALAAFERAAARQGITMALVAAPLGEPPERPLGPSDWLPGHKGLQRSWLAVYEALAYLASR